MERSEVKEMLKNKGVKSEFLEMPAVIEPIYKEFIGVSVESAKKSSRIKVDENGNFMFGNARISLDQEGCAIITDADVVIKTNKYGIETSFSDGDQFGRFNNMRRKDGKIVSIHGNNSDGHWNEIISLDGGSWSISGSTTFVISNRSSYKGKEETVEPVTFSIDKALISFDSTSKSIIRDYPNTAEYYATLREELIKASDKETDPLQVEIRKNAELQKQIDKLKKDKEELTSSLEKSTVMLGESLKFMERVRNHPIGKVFFGKDARKFEESKARLDSGKSTKVADERDDI